MTDDEKFLWKDIKLDEAKKMASDLKLSAKQDRSLPKEAAYLQSLLGQKDEAMSILQQAYEDHNIAVAEIKMDPRLDGLRADARVAKILQEIGLAQ